MVAHVRYWTTVAVVALLAASEALRVFVFGSHPFWLAVCLVVLSLHIAAWIYIWWCRRDIVRIASALGAIRRPGEDAYAFAARASREAREEMDRLRVTVALEDAGRPRGEA